MDTLTTIAEIKQRLQASFDNCSLRRSKCRPSELSIHHLLTVIPFSNFDLPIYLVSSKPAEKPVKFLRAFYFNHSVYNF